MSNVVSITTFASDALVGRAAAASPRSRRARACARPSGRRPAAAAAPPSTASPPSAASPTTSMSCSASRIIRKPARTSAWSSTIRTRTVPVACRLGRRCSPCRVGEAALVALERRVLERPQRRERRLQAGDDELVDAHRPVEVLQPLRAEVAQRRRRQSSSSSSSSDGSSARAGSGRRGPAAQIRAARCTASPRYWSSAARLAGVDRPSARARPTPSGQSCAASARCAATAASTASFGLRNATKNESPCVSISWPPASSKAPRRSRLCVASTSP